MRNIYLKIKTHARKNVNINIKLFDLYYPPKINIELYLLLKSPNKLRNNALY